MSDRDAIERLVASVPEALALLLADRGISNTKAVAMAREAGSGLTNGNLSKWHRGKQSPKIDTVVRYLAALGLDLGDLQDAVVRVAGLDSEAEGGEERPLIEVDGQHLNMEEVRNRFRKMCLTVLLSDPETQRFQPEMREPTFFYQTLLPHNLAVIQSNPKEGRNLAQLALQIAPDTCGAAQAWGQIAQCQRATGDLEGAHEALDNATRLGKKCKSGACMPDIFRRRSYVLLYQRKYSDALAMANQALDSYRKLGHCGHDSERNGLANSLNARAVIHFYAGDSSAALKDQHQAISVTDPTASPTIYRVAMFNLALFLSATGDREDLLRANEQLRVASRLFSGLRARSSEQAKLSWLTAMIQHQLGTVPPEQIRSMLEHALEIFHEIEVVEEVVAILADHARIAYPDQHAILVLIDRAIERLGLEKRLTLRMPELWQKLLGVRSAAKRSAKPLRKAIEDLREACGPGMLTCLIKWREA